MNRESRHFVFVVSERKGVGKALVNIAGPNLDASIGRGTEERVHAGGVESNNIDFLIMSRHLRHNFEFSSGIVREQHVLVRSSRQNQRGVARCIVGGCKAGDAWLSGFMGSEGL